MAISTQAHLRVPFLDLVAQYNDVKPELDAIIAEIFATGAYVLGKHNSWLEENVAALHGVDHAIAVNSGTDALRIAMQACGLGCGDEVITTAFTFVATIETAIQLGVKPVFVDIEPVAFQIDVSKIEAAITPNTKAILPIHLFGQMCEMEKIHAIAKKHNLMVLEDSAQAILSQREGVYAGNGSIASGISFYVTKNLGAAGDGGMILTNDPEVARRSKSLRVHGMGRERYYYDEIGYTSRLSEIQAAVLRVKLGKLQQWTERRQQIADRYNEAFAKSHVTPPVTLPGNNHTWHQYTVRTDRRDHLQAHLQERNIDSMIYYPVPLHYHEPYRFLGCEPGQLPETERACLEVLSLPVHQHMTDAQVDAVIAAVKAF